MNKDVFHNQLALLLGFKRILNNKGVNIKIDDINGNNDPKVIINFENKQKPITFNASETTNSDVLLSHYKDVEELKTIIDAVNQAYRQATTYRF